MGMRYVSPRRINRFLFSRISVTCMVTQTPVESAEDIVIHVDEDFESCMSLCDAVQKRSENENTDFSLLKITEWLTTQISENTQWFMAETVSDVSEKAILCEETYSIPTTVYTGQTQLFEDVSLEDSSVYVDDSDGEYVDEAGVKFFPKSQLVEVFTFID